MRNLTSASAVSLPTRSLNHKQIMLSSNMPSLHSLNQRGNASHRAFSSTDLSDKISSIISENKVRIRHRLFHREDEDRHSLGEFGKVVVFSKTYCPYCKATKQLFEKMGVDAEVIELDLMSNGDAMQAALTEFSGQRTVPNVFINGKHLGGNDATQAAKRSGKLEEMLK